MLEWSATSLVPHQAFIPYTWIEEMGENLDGKRYFVVAGFRIQHEDKVILVPFFTPIEN